MTITFCNSSGQRIPLLLASYFYVLHLLYHKWIFPSLTLFWVLKCKSVTVMPPLTAYFVQLASC